LFDLLIFLARGKVVDFLQGVHTFLVGKKKKKIVWLISSKGRAYAHPWRRQQEGGKKKKKKKKKSWLISSKGCAHAHP
jgi:hypothetical protein